MIITGIIFISLYSILVLLFVTGWKKTPVFKIEQVDHEPLTIVVACRNESTNLKNLLDALKKQTFSDFELVLVDDHSEDNTHELMQAALHDFGQIKVLKSVSYGKKNALKCGIEQATHKRILTTDADCIPPARWIETMSAFQVANGADLVIGPVELAGIDNLFSSIQHAEFQTLIASGAGMCAHNRAIMCNGANLLFFRDEWVNNFSEMKAGLQSGDDVFLLHTFKKQNKKIGFVKSKDAVVQTNTLSDFGRFFSQRKRWASKSPYYKDSDTIITASIILAVQVYLLLLLPYSLFNPVYLNLFILFLVVKCMIDMIFVQQTSDLLHKKITVKTILVLTVCYPFYIVYTALSGFFAGNQRYTYR